MVASLVAAGTVYAGSAHNSSITHVPLYTFNGDNMGDQFGVSVSGAGDVNGDGRPDLIVGAWFDDNNGISSGSARVFSSSDGSTLFTFYGDDAFDEFGWSVSGAGDINGDGYADLIVGALSDANNGTSSGSVRLISGINGSTLFSINGDSARDQYGISVSGAGDVNGDGIPDLIVGARFDDNNGTDSGSARVLSGLDASTLFTYYGESAFDEFGISVSGAGDVNGDGFADLIVGARLDDNNGLDSGSARLISGSDGSTLFTFNGDTSGDEFGRSVSSAGDVNGDGTPDLIIGAHLDDNNGSNSGSALVISGLDGNTLYTFNGDNAGDGFGRRVSGAGDLNGDGYADLIVGAWLDDNNGVDSGSVRMLSGIDGSTLYTFDGDNFGDWFGWSVNGVGDVNGDGLADFIVGARHGGENGGGYARLFVSVPEPGSLAVLCVAIPLIFRRRRG